MRWQLWCFVDGGVDDVGSGEIDMVPLLRVRSFGGGITDQRRVGNMVWGVY